VQVTLSAVEPVVAEAAVGKYVGKASVVAETMQEFATVAVTENDVVAVLASDGAAVPASRTVERAVRAVRRCRLNMVAVLIRLADMNPRLLKSDIATAVPELESPWKITGQQITGLRLIY
jgi:CTP:molybdopterin cytidylyltransferase MocA